jgi:hypothetical protein
MNHIFSKERRHWNSHRANAIKFTVNREFFNRIFPSFRDVYKS